MYTNPLVLTLSAIGAFIIAVYQWKQEEHTHNGRRTPILILSLFLLFMSLIAVWSQFFAEQQATKEKNKTQKELEEASRQIVSLQKEVKDSTAKIIQIQSELIQIQNETIKQIAGGNHKPLLSPTVFGSVHPNDIAFDIYNCSKKYPIMDVSIFFMEGLEIPDLSKLSYADRLKATNNASMSFNFGTLIKESGAPIFYRKTVPQDIKKVNYAIRVSWRNGSYLAQAQFERDEQGLFHTTIKYIGNNNKEIKINPDTEK